LGIWEGERQIGGINMHHVDRANRSTYLGYWLARDVQGRGIMTRVCRLMVDELIRHQGYNRVVIAVQPENTRSRTIPERLEFRQEGVLRQVGRLHGKFVDWVIYAMLANAWLDIRGREWP
jgi:ribosomal-protein-serine acetyltransferase